MVCGGVVEEPAASKKQRLAWPIPCLPVMVDAIGMGCCHWDDVGMLLDWDAIGMLLG